MTSMTLPAPAKLNLFLHVTGQRDDGYHTLQTLFQLLDLHDTLDVRLTQTDNITLEGPNLGIANSENLVMRAALKLREAAPATSKPHGAHITLHKRIPAGGGLGGGSSDAATTLLALNHLWQCGLSNRELQDLGRELGADVPVFVAGNSAWAEGIGEALTPVTLPESWYLIVAPDCPVSTAEIFSRPELTRTTPPITMATFFAGASRNDCQPVVQNLYPEVDKALKWLGNFGEAKLTGTGACVFARFESQASAEGAMAQLPEGWTAYVARGINRSPATQQLV